MRPAEAKKNMEAWIRRLSKVHPDARLTAETAGRNLQQDGGLYYVYILLSKLIVVQICFSFYFEVF